MADPLRALSKAETISAGPSKNQETGQHMFEGLMEALGGATGLPIGNTRSGAHAAGEAIGTIGPEVALKAIAVPAGLMRLLTKSKGSTEALAKIEPTLEELHTLDRLKESLLSDAPEATSMAGSQFKPGTPGWSNDLSLIRQQNQGGFSGRTTDARRVAQISQRGPVYLHPDDASSLLDARKVKQLNAKVDETLVPAGFKPQPSPSNSMYKMGANRRALTGTEAEEYKPLIDQGVSEVRVKSDAHIGNVGGSAKTKFTADQIRQAREIGNGELAHLSYPDAVREVKKRLGLTAADQDIRAMLKGETFYKIGGKFRPDR